MGHAIAITVTLYIAWLFYDFFKANVIPDSPEVVNEEESEIHFYHDYLENKN